MAGVDTEKDANRSSVVIACITLGALAMQMQINSWGTMAAVESLRQVNCPPAFVTYFVDLMVDTETGHVTTNRAVIGSDCGTVVNPAMAIGQLEGGLSKGMGYALIEEMVWDGPRLANPSLMDYKIPTMAELPEELHSYLVESAEPSGPFGAKSVGEIGINGVAAAIANAIANATGARLRQLPLSAERVLRGVLELSATGTAGSAG